MDLKDYKAGKFTNQFGYKSFQPESLNKEWSLNHPELAAVICLDLLTNFHFKNYFE
jgi:hypothetical protein